MYPVLIKSGNFVLRTYGLFVAIAAVTGILTSWHFARRRNLLDEDTFYNIAIWAIIGGVVGARVFWILTSPYLKEYLARPFEIIAVWRGGLSFGGMFFGGFIAVLLALRKYKVDLFNFLDIGSIGVAIGYGIGKFACFFNGCCHGVKVADFWPKVFPLSLYFTNPLSECELLNTYLYPAQLLNALSGWITFLVLLYLERKSKSKYPGQLFTIFGLMLGVMMFLVEFVRYIPVRILSLTPNQWGSIILIIIVLVFDFMARRQFRKVA